MSNSTPTKSHTAPSPAQSSSGNAQNVNAPTTSPTQGHGPNPDRAAVLAMRYNLSPSQADLSADRERIYGDAYFNHQGIAQTWAGLLQPWFMHIATLKPLPPHVVALLMCGLKLNRKRNVFHEDNYSDDAVYASFARTWQREYELATDSADKCLQMMSPPHPDARLVVEWETPDGTRHPAHH